ncbi:MAG TPA: hypothetical protein VF533_01380 [Solirubrobacteraceae bacterium]|jgi:hypothetical protein
MSAHPGVPRAAQWAAAAEGGTPPDVLFDFPDLGPGDVFRPAAGAYITAPWLPVALPWQATARIRSVSGERLTWTEENTILGRSFAAEVVFERTGPFAARLTIDAALGRLRLPRIAQDYEIVAVERELLAVRAGRADMLSLGRKRGAVMQFHLRLPFGIAIHKSGDLEHR